MKKSPATPLSRLPVPASGLCRRHAQATGSFAANAAIDAKHPKDKSEAWQKTKPLWGEFMPLQVMIEGLDKEKAALFEPVAALYAKAKERYLDYCRTATLYWNYSAKSSLYSVRCVKD